MNVLPDPYRDWDRYIPEVTKDGMIRRADGTLEPFRSVVKDKLELTDLPPEPGHWKNPASLSRFDNNNRFNATQLKSFTRRIDIVQLDWLTPCWLWTGGTHEKGYGRIYLGLVDNKRVHAYTHRVSFEHFVGMPPRGYIVDHQCNHKLCCNPTHLWPETSGDNTRKAQERRPWKRRNQYSKE